MTIPLHIAVIIGSTRQQRFSEKPAKWIFEEVQKLDGVTAELLDLRDFPLPFFDDAEPPIMRKGQHANPVVRAFGEKIASADAFIIVTPEYNYGYPAVLKNALDHFFYEWNKKVVGFVSYGGVAGARSVEQLRTVASGLDMVPLREAIHIAQFWSALDDQGNVKADAVKGQAEKFFPQLVWWGNALKNARSAT